MVKTSYLLFDARRFTTHFPAAPEISTTEDVSFPPDFFILASRDARWLSSHVAWACFDILPKYTFRDSAARSQAQSMIAASLHASFPLMLLSRNFAIAMTHQSMSLGLSHIRCMMTRDSAISATLSFLLIMLIRCTSFRERHALLIEQMMHIGPMASLVGIDYYLLKPILFFC